MNTAPLKKFAQWARRYLREQVGNKLEQILATDSGEMRKSKAVKDLLEETRTHGKDQVVEKVAYVWFNRFCALRFMDANGYNRTGIVSPAEGMTLPEILQEAKLGNVDEDLSIDRAKLSALLAEAKQDEAYRMLLVAACNQQSQLMPFMFEKIADYTELLMPSDLLSESSFLSELRAVMDYGVLYGKVASGQLLVASEETKNLLLDTRHSIDVEVIGWLYQFYISEKKDEVFDSLKKNKKITPENIPAATQLFTPNWIVRYLVENSLGRLWMLNKPNSRLIDQMEYYIKPEQEETDFLKVTSPEELKVCDPACGSGHMLVYAFELLYAIYEEEGYDAPEIPGLILNNNLFGLELDERAGELAAFALTMKAREKYRRFFRKAVQPNICVLEKSLVTSDEWRVVSEELVTSDEWRVMSSEIDQLKADVEQFRNADNFGSLIRPQLDEATAKKMFDAICELEKQDRFDLFVKTTFAELKKVLRMVEFLSPRYQVVVANPPYMGGKGMNAELAEYAKKVYSDSKSDLFAMFIERNLELVKQKGSVGMITMQSWMFLSSYEKLREKILSNDTILSMAHLGARGFDSIGGEVVQTTAFVLENEHRADYRGAYVRLVDGGNEAEKAKMFKEAIA